MWTGVAGRCQVQLGGTRVAAKVERQEVALLAKVRRTSLRDYATVLKDVASVGKVEPEHGILFTDENTDVVVLGEALDRLCNLRHHNRRKPQGWFVQEKQLRRAHQRPP